MSAKHTPRLMKVIKLDCHDRYQFNIESNWQEMDGDFDDRYVSFGGHFGSYNPHMFAAAPELLEALEAIVVLFEGSSGAGANHWEQFSEYRSARAVIAKAKGETK